MSISLALLLASAQLLAQPAAQWSTEAPRDAQALQRLGMSSQRLELLSSVLQQHVDDGRVPGLVAGIMHKGELVYLRAMGAQVVGESAMRARFALPDSLHEQTNHRGSCAAASRARSHSFG